jgi:lysophospholipase
MNLRNLLLVGVSIALLSCKTFDDNKPLTITPSEEAVSGPKPFQLPPMPAKWLAVQTFFATGERGSFDGERGLKIAHIKFDHDTTRPIIVIASGMSETFLKYQEFIYDLDQAGFSVYSMDHRGMGYSGREIGNRQLIHILDVDDYHRDFASYLSNIVPADGRPKYLFTHSTGGFIGTEFLASHPKYFSKAILSSRLFKVKVTGPNFVTDFILWTRILRGLGDEPVQGKAISDPREADFKKNNVTHSNLRFDEDIRLRLENSEIVMSEPTNDWVKKMREALTTRWLKNTTSKISAPIFVFQAELDQYVDADTQNTFCSEVAKCEINQVKGGFHELYREVDGIREPYLTKISEFFR